MMGKSCADMAKATPRVRDLRYQAGDYDLVGMKGVVQRDRLTGSSAHSARGAMAARRKHFDARLSFRRTKLSKYYRCFTVVLEGKGARGLAGKLAQDVWPLEILEEGA